MSLPSFLLTYVSFGNTAHCNVSLVINRRYLVIPAFDALNNIFGLRFSYRNPGSNKEFGQKRIVFQQGAFPVSNGLRKVTRFGLSLREH